MATVNLTTGEYIVSEPTLEAWDAILNTVTDQHWKALATLITSLMETPDGELAEGRVLSTMLNGPMLAAALPIISSSPRLAAVIAEGCLRTQQGDPVPKGMGSRLTLNDAIKVIQTALTSGALDELGKTLGNLLAPLRARVQAARQAEESKPNAA